MTVAFESGYTLPGGDEPLNHARMLHARNQFLVRTVAGQEEDAALYPLTAANNALTYESWRPYVGGLISSPQNFNDAAWTATNITVSATDEQTLTFDDGSGIHDISDGLTFASAEEHVAGVIVDRQTQRYLRIRANDGTTNFTGYFDLLTKTVGTTDNCTASIVEQTDGKLYLAIVFTPLAAVGFFNIAGVDAAESATYDGDDNTIRVFQAFCHPSEITYTMTLDSAQEGDCFAIAAHNLGTRGGTVEFSYGGTPTSIGSQALTDDTPVLFIFEPVTSDEWVVTITGVGAPAIGVIRVGKALQFERPFYGGHMPITYGRQSTMRSQESETGEFIGRTRQRTALSTSMEWMHLSTTWVDANVPDLQRALEEDPAFIAWRPSDTEDVAYGTVDSTPKVSKMGIRDLMQMSFAIRGYSRD